MQKFILILMVSATLGLVSAHAQKAKPADGLSFSFVNAEIEAVARGVGKIIGRPVVVDPRVTGRLTLVMEEGVSSQKALDQFSSALRLLGFTVLNDGESYMVLPETVARLYSRRYVEPGEKLPDSNVLVTKIFRLEYADAAEILPVVRPLISPSNVINLSKSANALIVTDYASNLRRVERILRQLDQVEPWRTQVIPISHAIASDIAASVVSLLDGGTAIDKKASSPRGTVRSDELIVLADKRTNSVVLRFRSNSLKASALELISQLDKPATAEGGFRVIRLRHARAEQLLKSLQTIFGSGKSVVDGKAGASTASLAAAGSTTFGIDEATNSILLAASANEMPVLERIVRQLDSERVQVFVESLIAEVRTDKAAEFGFQWQFPLGNRGDGVIGLMGTNFDAAGNNILNITAQPGASLPSPGLNIGMVTKQSGTYVLSALGRFLEENGVANILATPTLLTVDNQRAKIVIGQNVPFVTGQYATSNASANVVNPFQTIERRDVGLTLEVRTQVGTDGNIRLEIYQEASNVSTSNPAGLITNKRSIESNVVVQDGQIVVLGGLTQEEASTGDERVPGLSNLPIVGQLFQRKETKRSKSNLMVFIRPIIVDSQSSAGALSLEQYNRMRAQQVDKSQPDDLPVPRLPEP